MGNVGFDVSDPAAPALAGTWGDPGGVVEQGYTGNEGSIACL
jgi:hypothetical protein